MTHPLPTYLLTYLSIHLPTYLPTYLLTYLPIPHSPLPYLYPSIRKWLPRKLHLLLNNLTNPRWTWNRATIKIPTTTTTTPRITITVTIATPLPLRLLPPPRRHRMIRRTKEHRWHINQALSVVAPTRTTTATGNHPAIGLSVYAHHHSLILSCFVHSTHHYTLNHH